MGFLESDKNLCSSKKFEIEEMMEDRGLAPTEIRKFTNPVKDAKFGYMLMEKCDEKTVLDLINDNFDEEGLYIMPEDTIQLVFGQIVSSCLYLVDKRRMVHRDLKPENMLMKNSESGEPVVKMCDFGFTRTIANQMTTVTGTTMYVDKRIGKEAYNSKADLYSLGCILYNLYFGYNAYTSWDEDKNEYVECDDLEMDDVTSQLPVGQLMIMLLEKDHEKRISWEDFKKNEYVVEALNVAAGKKKDAEFHMN